MCIEKRIVNRTNNVDQILKAMQKFGETKYLASDLERQNKAYTNSSFVWSTLTDRRRVSKDSSVQENLN